MAYGDHYIAPPWKRWCILVGYWTVLATFLVPGGLIHAVFVDYDWKPLSWLHAAHLIVSTSIFLSTWTFGAYAFEREWSLFPTIVYPLGQTLDTLMWIALFDLGKSTLAGGHASMVTQYLLGLVVLDIYILSHRRTLELTVLPEHHPPRQVRGNLLYVPAAICSGALLVAVYHWTGDLYWCLLVKYCQELYFCIRMRMPAPWMKYSNEHDQTYGWNWEGF